MIRRIYLYLVLFTTLMMSIGGCVGIFMSLSDIIVPRGFYQDYASYRETRIAQATKVAPGEPAQPVPDEATIRADYERLVADQMQEARRRGLNGLIKSLGWIVIPLPVFLWYSRKLKEDKGSSAAASA
ncbi:hypothetical protein [Kyrpidia tusciae]|uniref:Lipoprotein n=1 Tax=Kyrpidia tusciae (strain DSM 2912 / NBRC 15312 / T2) TaxID=562970 RepID=D5WRY8_KYRT2|nr:hypothetical protein [Kyrpidia tusciae]ADG06940.1 conserved hypothetical protein [Kyrpidia tusciae DSM 2912]